MPSAATRLREAGFRARVSILAWLRLSVPYCPALRIAPALELVLPLFELLIVHD